MSLRTALSTKKTIVEVYKGILTISDIGIGFNQSVLYSCFCQDIPLYHPLYGMGEIISFDKNKWHINFVASSSIQEFSTQTLLHYLPLN